MDDYMLASKRWAEVRPKLQAWEIKAECDSSGAASDAAIAQDVIDGFVKAPVQVIVSATQLVLAFAAHEKDDFFKALKDAYKSTTEHAYEGATGKVGDKAQAQMEKAYQRLRETLIQYLQSVSKRSRKHFKALLDGLWGTVKSMGKITSLAGSIMISSTKITPEWCGYLNLIDEEQRKSLERIAPMPNGALKLPLNEASGPRLVNP